jgi:hypothetical protein
MNTLIQISPSNATLLMNDVLVLIMFSLESKVNLTQISSLHHVHLCTIADLQVDETKAVQILSHEAALSRGSVEAALAVAKAQLEEGNLVAAVGACMSKCK